MQHSYHLKLPSPYLQDKLREPLYLKPDQLFWNESKLGRFSVKRAYYMQLKHHVEDKEGECSLLVRDRKFWKFLWSLSLPPNIKAFMWRACVVILPTHGLLWHYHMRIDGVCPCCNPDVESVAHALWSGLNLCFRYISGIVLCYVFSISCFRFIVV